MWETMGHVLFEYDIYKVYKSGRVTSHESNYAGGKIERKRERELK